MTPISVDDLQKGVVAVLTQTIHSIANKKIAATDIDVKYHNVLDYDCAGKAYYRNAGRTITVTLENSE